MSNPKLRIIVDSDDAGSGHRKALLAMLESDSRVEVVSSDVSSPESHEPYPRVALAAAKAITAGYADRALLICGTGLGMAISANKVRGVRAVTAHDGYSVERSVLSNNAQVLCFGQRVIGLELAKHLVNIWLNLRFDPQTQSAEKIALITDFEQAQEKY